MVVLAPKSNVVVISTLCDDALDIVTIPTPIEVTLVSPGSTPETSLRTSCPTVIDAVEIPIVDAEPTIKPLLLEIAVLNAVTAAVLSPTNT